jgi:galactokinase
MRDAMIDAPGAIGARQAGAGFGGCLVALVDRTDVPAFVAAVERGYQQRAGRRGSVFEVRAAAGARVLPSGVSS